MPTKTLAALSARAIEAGLDPKMPALAIARATRPDETVIAGTIAQLPALLAETPLSGPVLVLIGKVCAARSRQQRPATGT